MLDGNVVHLIAGGYVLTCHSTCYFHKPELVEVRDVYIFTLSETCLTVKLVTVGLFIVGKKVGLALSIRTACQ